MIRNWHDLFGRVGFALGLLLVAHLGHAFEPCVSPSRLGASASVMVSEQRCQDASALSDECLAVLNGNDLRAAASSFSSADPSSAGPALHASTLRLAAAEPQIPSGFGPAPGFRSPVHILFRRFLS